MLERQRDVVQPVEQAALAFGFDVERDWVTADGPNALGFQIDRQAQAWGAGNEIEQILDNAFVKLDRQHAVLEAVAVEDVGKARCDQRADAEIRQCPGGMLPAGSATEVVTREQDLCARETGLVQHEIGIWPAGRHVLARLTVVEIAPLVEQVNAEAGALHRFHELLRDDRIGVDIRAVEWHDECFQFGKGLHQRPLRETSTK